jgi:phosphatidate phosphatase APP1
MRKRLHVLFTQNARSRRPFEGVVRHYQLLAQTGTTNDAPNPFFYVSSSEWNLYEYILEFSAINHIPRGIFLLSQLKGFSQLLKTGQNNHGTKFTRIVRILKAFPNHRVILLGDSSQQDPYIYENVVKHFPKQVHAVYIRDVHQKTYEKVKEVLQSMEAAGVPCLFFKHSEEAILHSVKIGLISPEAAEEKLHQAKEEKHQMA